MRVLLFPLFFLASCSKSQFNSSTPAPVAAVSKSSVEDSQMHAPAKGNSDKVTSAPESLPGQKTASPVESLVSSTVNISQKLFNAAILTQGVRCLFCHMRIEGDVGGIKFPQDADVHERTGEAVRIFGALFGTNKVPDKLNNGKVAIEVHSYYQNSELKIFPTTMDEDGEIIFPQIRKELLNGKTKGNISLGSLKIEDSYFGNLNLVSSQSVLEINGEFFIDGDVILGGAYRGTGTIYAKNIFIVRDLTSSRSVYPYDIDPVKAKDKAKHDILEKKDGLYLLALGQITVGYPDPAFISRKAEWRKENPASVGISNLYPPIKMDKYIALAVPKTCELSHNADHSRDYASVLVNQVDAFLYASDFLLWRTCGGYSLNGGFATPYAALVNAKDANKNDSADPANVIRYDYRLRAGVKAFAILRDFFEQE